MKNKKRMLNNQSENLQKLKHFLNLNMKKNVCFEIWLICFGIVILVNNELYANENILIDKIELGILLLVNSEQLYNSSSIISFVPFCMEYDSF
jgi:hypothetical protein